MALVQEMAVKIDQGFLGAILALFTPAADPQADSEKVELLLTCEKCQHEPHTERVHAFEVCLCFSLG